MTPDSTPLKRQLNVPLLFLYGLGTILGAGIYVLVGKVAGSAGMYAPLAFVLSAVIAIFTGLSYSQLSVKYPRSAGEALYVEHAFSWPLLSRLVGWGVICTGLVSAATLVNGFAGYLSVFVHTPHALAVTLAVVVITLIACWGILESVSIAAVITLVETGGLLLVVFALRQHFGDLPDRLNELVPPLDTTVWLGILMGAFIAFYAFIGFEDMVNVIEEVRQPSKSMPRAIMLALGVSSVFYFIVALVAVLAADPVTLNNSRSPMVDLLRADHPGLAKSVGMISLIAIINGALVQIIMGSRLLYGMACQNIAPRIFQRISTRTRTPVLATLAIGTFVCVFALALPLVTLAKLTSFIIILVFTLVNLALLVIRLRENRTQRWTRKICLILQPLIAASSCIALLLVPLIHLI